MGRWRIAPKRLALDEPGEAERPQRKGFQEEHRFHLVQSRTPKSSCLIEGDQDNADDNRDSAAPVYAESRLSSALDRKSTRLNSSHRCNSYAVLCLKKNDRVYIDHVC